MAAPPQAMRPMSLREAVAQAGQRHDARDMVWLRRMGSRPSYMLRSGSAERFQGYIVTPRDVVPALRNWPRALHEGLWGGYAGSVVNLLLSAVLAALTVTGLLLWWRRRRLRRAAAAARAAA